MLGRSSLLPKQLPRSPGSLFPTHTSTLRLQSRRAPVQQRATSHIGLDISTPRIKPRTRYEVEGYSAFSTIRMAPTRCHHFFTGVSSIGAAPLSHSAVYPSMKHWAQRLLYFGWKHGVGKNPSKALALWEGFMGMEFSQHLFCQLGAFPAV
jgi:hypothetical protein